MPLKIEDVGVVTSTQDVMKARLERGERVHGLVLRAAAQTLGRGQRSKTWQSGAGGSYQTLAVHLPEATRLNSRASIAVAVGLAQTLPRYGVKVGIKWPNDLYYRRKKLAGILLEQTHHHLLIGVGVNVNNEVPPGAVGLRGWDLAGVHGVVLEGVQAGLSLLDAPLAAAYAPFDLLYGQEVEGVSRGERIVGTARGADEDGGLRLERTAGRVDVFRGTLTRFTLRK